MSDLTIFGTLSSAGILLASLGMARFRADLRFRKAELLRLSLAAEESARKQDHVLRAIIKIAAELMAAPSIDAALPEALRRAGEAIEADRVVVLEGVPAPDQGFLVQVRYAWNAPDTEPKIRAGFLAGTPETAAKLGAIFAALPADQAVREFPRTQEGKLAPFLRALNIRSNLLVPILVEGQACGFLSFDDCHKERVWTTAESDSLQILAGMVGASMARARHIAELADSKRIIENSATVLFRARPLPGMPLVYISENISRLGYSAAQFLASPRFHLTRVHPEDAGPVAEWIENLLADTNPPSWHTFRVRRADGSYRWFECHITAIRDARQQPTFFEGMMFDITERKLLEQQLTFVNTLFVTALETSPNGFLAVGPDRRVLAHNQRFLDMWSIPRSAASSKLAASTLDDRLLSDATSALKDPQRFRTVLDHLYTHPEEEIQDELEFRDGRIFERHSAALRNAAREYLGRVFSFQDVTERKRAERDMVRLAHTDALTGLANRGAFLDRLGQALAASRRGGKPFAVHYIDLDNFKDINDMLGHQIGDGLLKGVAERLAAAVRVTDLAARLGGDEFALLQADVQDPSTAGTLAIKLRAAVAEPFRIENNTLRVAATVGIALYASDLQSSSEILAQADRALYRAKEEGGDRYRFHSRELDAAVHERISLAEELRGAIDRDELQLFYQPQVAIASGEIVGVEALVRWNHPGRGQLTPAAFLPAAERSGVILPLGAWVLDQACRQFRQWRDQGVAPAAIAINLSSSQLKLGHDLERIVSAALEKWGLLPQDLEFDVPEAALSPSSGINPEALDKLQQLGVGIAIDDFGADGTCLNRIKTYRIKRLKIAPQFIAAMTSSSADASAVRMMIQVSKALGVEIVAKNIENAAQENFLRTGAQGVEGQGYLYSKPLPARQITELLQRRFLGPSAGQNRPATVLESVKEFQP